MKNSSFFISITKITSTLFILVLIISMFFIPILYNDYNNINPPQISNSIIDNNSNFIWPIPGYTRISSPFGKRIAPTSGASSYHKGTDIPASTGTPLYAISDGYITFTNFLGGGGYTITLSISDSIKVSYCHVSPNYIVKKGDFVKQGQLIGHVGPKYVYGVPGNKYKDSAGNPTNGATTGPHLHIGFRINNNYVDPLIYLKMPDTDNYN